MSCGIAALIETYSSHSYQHHCLIVCSVDGWNHTILLPGVGGGANQLRFWTGACCVRVTVGLVLNAAAAIGRRTRWAESCWMGTRNAGRARRRADMVMSDGVRRPRDVDEGELFNGKL